MSIYIQGCTYRTDLFTLGEINLSIKDGEHVHLTGPNGSGKSLLLEIICGLRTPHTGSIHINDKDVTNAPPNERGLGYVPQNGGLFSSMTVAQQVSFPLTVRKRSSKSIQSALDHISSHTRIEHLLNREVSKLSGGEQQRVAIARALIHQPKTVLLDEPTSALDEKSQVQIEELLTTIATESKVTILHVLHDRNLRSNSSRKILYMAQGKITQNID